MGHSQTPVSPIRVGVSACLLGQRVRYDGGHKADPFIIDTLGRYFSWVPVCPEVEIGLGTPREPICLEGDAAAPSLIAAVSGRNLTGLMQDFAAQRLLQLADLVPCNAQNVGKTAHVLMTPVLPDSMMSWKTYLALHDKTLVTTYSMLRSTSTV